MAHCNTVLSQMLKMIPRHEFEKLANTVDGKVRSTALSRWSQFVALTVGQLNGRQSLRDIENCLSAQQHLNYHLGVKPMNNAMRSFTRAYSKCFTVAVPSMHHVMVFALRISCFHWTVHCLMPL